MPPATSEAAVTPPRLRYIPALDGMRGLSLPGTILTHYALFLQFKAGAPHWLRSVGPLTLNIQMFFVLSGALITSLLVSEYQRTGTVSLKMFYLRRSRRLGPALLAAVLGMGALQVFWHGTGSAPLGGHPALALGAVAIFLGNWVLFSIPGGLGWLGPAWTLGIEEQFYLSWPALLVLALRRRVRRSTLYASFAAVLVAALLTAGAITHSVGIWRAFYATPIQLPSILFGCALGYELTANPSGRLAGFVRFRLIALIGFAGMAGTSVFLSRHAAHLYQGGYAVYATFACLLIGHCFVRAAEPTLITKVLGWKPFVVIGQVSYEAYLVHVIVIIGVARAFPSVRVYPMMAIDTIVVALVSAIFYYTVEQPIRKRGWKAAFAGRERRPAVLAPARRMAFAGALAGVLALAGVGVVAARTATSNGGPSATTAGGTGSSHLVDKTSHSGGDKAGQPVTSVAHNGDAVNDVTNGGATTGGVKTNGGSATGGGCAGLAACSSNGVHGAHRTLVAPTITALTPPTGPITGGTTMTIHGAHFTPDAKVFFNDMRAANVTRVDSTTLRIVTPSAQSVAVHTALAQLHGLQVTVSVVTAGGTSTKGVANTYTYV